MLARLDGFNAKSGRTRRKRYERRDDETRRCAAGRRFLFVAPFSVAHPCRQEKGIRLLFFLSPHLASCPLSRARIIRSYRIVSVPWKRCGEGVVAWGDTPRRVGGVIWLLVPRPVLSSRSAARSISPYRLAGRMRAPFFVSSFSCVIPWRLVVSFSFSSRSSSRLPVSCGRLVSILCGSLIYPFHLVDLSASRRSVLRLVFSSRSAVRLLRLVLSVSLGRLVKQPVFSRFAWRLVSAARRAGRALSVSRLILFCSRIISLVASHRHDDERRLVLPLPRGSVPLSRCPVVESDWAMTVGGNGRAVRRYGRRAVFVSSISPSGRGMK